ncbi:hypothetical protein BH09PAT3_BH09PAT3_7100 [soil metagenome]
MAERIDPIDVYRSRLVSGESHVSWGGDVANKVQRLLRNLGHVSTIEPRINIAHGLLVFGNNVQDRIDLLSNNYDSYPRCVPWLVSPDAPYMPDADARHQFVAREFRESYTEPYDFKPDRAYGTDSVGTYGVMVEDEHVALAPSFGDYMPHTELMNMAIGRVVEISKDLGMVKFCLQRGPGAWSVVQDGVQERMTIR